MLFDKDSGLVSMSNVKGFIDVTAGRDKIYRNPVPLVSHGGL